MIMTQKGKMTGHMIYMIKVCFAHPLQIISILIFIDKQVYTIMSVSFVRRAGGYAVPVFVDQPDDYYHQLLPQLNGLYLPGGASAVLDSGYADVAYKAFRSGQ